jgi:hypothetical protein
VGDATNNRDVEWETQLLDYGTSQFKHWASFKYLDRIPENVVAFTKWLRNSNVPQTIPEPINLNTLLHIGLHSELLAVKLTTTTYRAFRIGGYELVAHVKGKQRAR